MSDRLNPRDAFLLCDRLSRHFRMDNDKKESLAEKLIQYCVGGYRDERYYSPYKQAEWVIEYMIDNWTRLERTAMMRQLAMNNFTRDPPYSLGKKPEVACHKCEDSGFDTSQCDRCVCVVGQALHPDVLRMFQHPPQQDQTRATNGSLLTAAKLRAHGYKDPKRKPRPMTRIDKRIAKTVASKLKPK